MVRAARLLDVAAGRMVSPGVVTVKGDRIVSVGGTPSAGEWRWTWATSRSCPETLIDLHTHLDRGDLADWGPSGAEGTPAALALHGAKTPSDAARRVHDCAVRWGRGSAEHSRWAGRSMRLRLTPITPEVRGRLLKLMRERPGLGATPVFPSPRNLCVPVTEKCLRIGCTGRRSSQSCHGSTMTPSTGFGKNGRQSGSICRTWM